MLTPVVLLGGVIVLVLLVRAAVAVGDGLHFHGPLSPR